jgi:peptide/nickel transport system substrate-binding protein
LLALLLALGLFAAACGSSDDEPEDTSSDDTTEDTDGDTDADDEEPEDTSDDDGDAMEETPVAGSVAYGNAQEFSNYNNGLASSNSTKNGIILTQVLPSPFAFAGPGGQLQQTELIDSATVVSADPQVIEYQINADAVWSDGDPVDCAEFYFTWKAYNGLTKQLDADGNVVTDPEDDTVELTLFEVTGDTGYKDIESLECSDDGKTVTATYSTIFADWQSLFSEMMPVHVIEREAGVADAAAAFDSDDRAGIEAMAEFFNTAWAMNPGELLDESLIPAAGPLKLGSWEAGSSLTLVPNENYYGTMANGDVVVRYIAEEAQAQALANGEINAMDPQPTPDLLASLNQTDGVVVEPGPQFVWEHFDFNFTNDALANRDVREAFALCLPRQQMVSNLIDPLSPGAQILNNRYNQEFELTYADASGGAYDQVDLERAQELLDASGVAQPVDIRLGWFDNGGNARRTDQVALTIESCNQIGFNVIDNGSDTFFDVELSAGDWDIAMFAWAGSPLKTGSDQIYRTGGGINFGGYGNPDVDALLDQISQELDPATQADLANQVDAILWEDLVSIPVFSFPGVVAYGDNVDGVVFNPSQNGLTWNASTWQLS